MVRGALAYVLAKGGGIFFIDWRCGGNITFSFLLTPPSLEKVPLLSEPRAVVGGLLHDPPDLCLSLPLVADEGVLRQGEHAAMEPFALLWGAGKAGLYAILIIACPLPFFLPPPLGLGRGSPGRAWRRRRSSAILLASKDRGVRWCRPAFDYFF